MIVWYKTYYWEKPSIGIKKGDFKEYKLNRIEPYCCEKMKNAFVDDFIIFGEVDASLNRDKDINITTCEPYPEGRVWLELDIQYCPFCGEKIEVKEVGE